MIIPSVCVRHVHRFSCTRFSLCLPLSNSLIVHFSSVMLCCTILFHFSCTLMSAKSMRKMVIKMLIIEFYWISIIICKCSHCSQYNWQCVYYCVSFASFLPFTEWLVNRIFLTSSSMSIKCITKSMHVFWNSGE